MQRVAVVAAAIVVLALVVSGCSWLFGQSRVVSPQEALRALNVALDHIGTPYEWGGRGPDSFDCSGLITFAYRRAVPGFRLRDGWATVDDGSMAVLYADSLPTIGPRPGDLVFLTDGTARVTHGACSSGGLTPRRSNSSTRVHISVKSLWIRGLCRARSEVSGSWVSACYAWRAKQAGFRTPLRAAFSRRPVIPAAGSPLGGARVRVLSRGLEVQPSSLGQRSG